MLTRICVVRICGRCHSAVSGSACEAVKSRSERRGLGGCPKVYKILDGYGDPFSFGWACAVRNVIYSNISSI